MKIKNQNSKKYIIGCRLFLAAVSMVIILQACKKFVQVDGPIDQVSSRSVFNNDQTAEAAVNGIYSNMLSSQLQVNNSALTIYTGLSSDELYYYTPSTLDAFTTNKISLINHGDIEVKFWTPLYRYIYTANACIEGLEGSAQVTAKLKNTLEGEARLIRAFCYFQLVNLFGKVPLLTSTDLTFNGAEGRAEPALVYGQIVNDLTIAIEKLPIDPANPEKTRPGKNAAKALLAKVYLYNKNWDSAAKLASEIISSNYQLADVTGAFLSNSVETIWQFKPVNPARNTFEAREIVPSSGGATPTYLLNDSFVNSFDVSDKRRANWIASRLFAGKLTYYPYKYKVRGGTGIPQTEYIIVFRLAEQLLIRAEAYANLSNLTAAIADVDLIRKRAGMQLLSSSNPTIGKEDLLLEIEQQRKKEFFVEWGNRWFDLKRNGRADIILGGLKPTWTKDAILWPVPESEILKNNNLLPQNQGY